MNTKQLFQSPRLRLTLPAVALVVLLAACSLPQSLRAPAAPTPMPTPVAIAQVAEPTAVPTMAPLPGVTTFGSVEPVDWIELSLARAGQVEEIMVAEGEMVEAGQPLLRLRTTDLSLSIEAAAAALATAKARLSELAAGPRLEEVAAVEALLAAAEVGVSAANAQYSVLTSPDPSAVAAAEASLAAADARARASQINYDFHINNELLGPAEETARYQLYADQKALAAAQSNLDVVRAGVTDAQRWSAGVGINMAQAQVETIRAQLNLVSAGPRQESLAVLQSEVRQAEVALAIAQAGIEQTEQEAVLVAPFAGVIASLMVRPAQTVLADQPLVVLADLSQMQVKATDVDELFIVDVQTGQEATITFDALPGQSFLGEVTAISLRPTALTPAVAATSTGSGYTVTIRMNQFSPDLRWGMMATVRIQTGSVR